MSDILLYYKRPDPITWVYLSSFLTIGLYFVFHRFWSIRNLDILLLILLAPGLLMVHEGYRRQLSESEAIARQKSDRLEFETRTAEAKAMTSLAGTIPMFALSQVDVPEDNGEASAQGELGKRELGNAESGNAESGNAESGVDSVSVDGAEVAQSGGAEASEQAGVGGAEDQHAGNDIVHVDEGDHGEVDKADAPVPSVGISTARDLQRWGFIYLFVIEALLLIRLMLDPLMVRRPLLDPNLTAGGLTFIGISLFIFMMANVLKSNPRIQVTQGPALGPGYAMMNMLPAIPTRPVTDQLGGVSPPTNAELTDSQARLATIAKVLAILAQLAIVCGIVLISNRHFSNLRAGVGCATLYLMLPYTAQMTGRVDHALPAALLLWAVLSYRRPMIAGIFLGLAGGLVYYPLFLLPLWFSFYWTRGARHFAIGVVAMLALLMVALSFDDSHTLTDHLRRMFGVLNPLRQPHELRGIWSLGWHPMLRLPVIVGFVILSVFFAIWPAQKNLGTLLSGSAALMVAAQFWHGFGGGLYIAWFLPLLLLTIFRPNLQDRVATKVVTLGARNAAAPRSELEPV